MRQQLASMTAEKGILDEVVQRQKQEIKFLYSRVLRLEQEKKQQQLLDAQDANLKPGGIGQDNSNIGAGLGHAVGLAHCSAQAYAMAHPEEEKKANPSKKARKQRQAKARQVVMKQVPLGAATQA